MKSIFAEGSHFFLGNNNNRESNFLFYVSVCCWFHFVSGDSRVVSGRYSFYFLLATPWNKNWLKLEMLLFLSQLEIRIGEWAEWCLVNSIVQRDPHVHDLKIQHPEILRYRAFFWGWLVYYLLAEKPNRLYFWSWFFLQYSQIVSTCNIYQKLLGSTRFFFFAWL